MTHKYEKFKEHIKEKGIGFIKTHSIEREPSSIRNIETLGIQCIYFDNEEFFKQFEEKYDEKQKKDEIKEVISKTIYCLDYDSLSDSSKTEVLQVCDELRKKDLIK